MSKIALYFDLQKAIDRTKLVQVQRTVTRKNGTTFLQNFWVNPSDVKSSDKVIGNQKVLDDFNDQQKKAAQQTNNTLITFNQSAYDQLKNDREKAMEYAEKCGVQFTKTDKEGKPLSEAIRWMRCQMAVSKLSKTAPAITVPTLSLKSLPQNFDTMDKKSKMVELLKNNSRKELMDFARRNGITWSETDKSGNTLSESIIWMRASMAIQKFIEGKSLADLTSTSGNKVAPTQQKTTQTPPPPSDKMEIPVGATERQKNIINLLNNVSDPEELKLYKSIGIVAEDDDAKAFIKGKLKPRYDEWKTGHAPNSGGSQASSSTSFGQGLSDELNSTFKGIPKKALKEVFTKFHNNFSMYGMLYPRMAFRTSSSNKLSVNLDVADRDWGDKNTIEGVLRLTTSFFSGYNTDGTKIINDSYNLDQCTKDYDPKKEGFLSVLNHIAKQDADLKDECDRIAGIYDSMMSKVGYNHELLNQVLKNRYSTITQEIKTFEDTQKKVSTIISILKNKGYSDAQIDSTMEHNRYSDWGSLIAYDHRGYPIRDANNNRVYIDLTHEPEWEPNWGYMAYSADMRIVQKTLKGEPHPDTEKIAALRTITPQTWLEIRALECDMAGVEVFNPQTGTSVDLRNSSMKPEDWDNLTMSNSYELKPKQGMDDVDYVFGNLYHMLMSVDVKQNLSYKVPQYAPKSAANDHGSDWTGNFDFYQGLGGRLTQMSIYPSPQLTFDQMNAKTKEVLDSEKVFSKKYLEDARKFAEDNGDSQFNSSRSYWFTPPTDPEEIKKVKAQSIGIKKGSSFKDVNGTPGGDVLQNLIQSIASYCPQMKTARYNTSDKLRKHVDDVLEYTPTMFSDGSSSQTPQTPAEVLRKLREEAFPQINCTLQTCDSTVNNKNETLVKHNWDKGMRGSSGNRLYGHITGVFHKSYEVRNSIQEEKFKENCKKFNETPKVYFHGTNHSGVSGIIGVDGHFIVPKDSHDASKKGLKYAGGMLGPGVYLAEMAGKSSGYFGTWGAGYNKEGCLLICESILGNHFTSSDYSKSKNAPSSYDSVSMKAGTNTGRTILRADEWCVRNPDFVFPKYIMDMEVKDRV